MAVLPPDPVYSFRCADMGAVHSLCFHRSERLLAGTRKGSVFLWDMTTNRSSLNFEVDTQPINSVHHTDEMLITQQKGGTIKIWAVTNSCYALQHTIVGAHAAFCRSVLYSDSNAGEELLFYPHEENSIGVLRLHSALGPSDSTTQLLVPDDPKLPKLGSIACLKPFSSGGQNYVLAGYEAGHFLTWDLNAGRIIDLVQLEDNPMAIDYDPFTNRGVVGGPTEKLVTVSYQRQNMQLQGGSDITIKNPGINCIRIRGDQKVFATGGWDGRIRIFSWKSLRPLAVLTEHKAGGIMDIVYSQDKVSMWKAPIMAAAGLDSQISLWDLYN